MQAYSGTSKIKGGVSAPTGKSEIELYGLDNKYQGYLMYPHYFTHNNKNIMYASSSHPDNVGLVMSEDQGRTWKNVYSTPGATPLQSFRIPGTDMILFWLVQQGVGKMLFLRADYSLHTEHTDMKNPFNASLSIINPSPGVFVYAEYSQDGNRLWKTSNYGYAWELLTTIPGIRHIHSLNLDPYTGDWWLGTGDYDDEPRILRSKDQGVTWETLQGAVAGVSNQQSRVCGFGFTEKFIIYGTDAVGVGEVNNLYRTGRDTFDPQIVSEIIGSCFGIYRAIDGTFYFHTMGEGASNDYSLVYRTDGYKVKEIMRTYRSNPPSQGGIHRMTAPDRMNRVMFGNKDAWGQSLGLMTIPIGAID